MRQFPEPRVFCAAEGEDEDVAGVPSILPGRILPVVKMYCQIFNKQASKYWDHFFFLTIILKSQHAVICKSYYLGKT